MSEKIKNLLCTVFFSLTFLIGCSTKTPEGMVRIPAESENFIMGNDSTGQYLNVSFTYDFWMDSVPVTQYNYQKLMGKNPSRFAGDLNRPVENVTWFDAALYCNERSKRDNLDTVYIYSEVEYKTDSLGNYSAVNLVDLSIDLNSNGYRLPTEAEWEYACRGGTQTTFFWGNSDEEHIISRYAVWNFNSWVLGKGDPLYGPNPVGSKKPNQFGLYDMVGNVWEWCNDWWDKYPISNEIDPTGPDSGLVRIMRGGTWRSMPRSLSSFHRSDAAPDFRDKYTGFRAVRPVR
ncbi:protein of unknown function DUF323 [Chitinispirillum alkaliphilum]|nr:protein of unknown function DUF323 [Chitinispirillum alkaliphilum]